VPIISEEGGGGGLAIGASYLTATLDASGNVAMGLQVFANLTLATSAGSDLTVAGHTVTVVRAGVYIAGVRVTISGAVEAYQVDLSPSAIGTYDVSGSGLDAAFGGLDVPLVTPPLIFSGPGSFTVSVYADNTGSVGTFTFGTAAEALRVMRLA
jgi:hypothetical protein